MKKSFYRLVLVCFLLCLPLSAFADVSALISQADSLFNYDTGTMEEYQKSADLYKQALKEDPTNYEATWKCARSLRFYADKAKQTNAKGWKAICAREGKEGMGYAQKAIAMNPNKPDGYYFFALNVGVYSDGVSILTALKEGLKDKTQSSFEKVLKLNKNYEKGGAILGIGRFWAVLPWPMKNKKKALDYYRQYQATPYFGTTPEGIVYVSELLIEIGGDANKAEAKKLLTGMKTDNAYYKKYAQDLLKKI